MPLRRKAALYAATASIVMFFAAMGAEMGMRQNLIIPGDASSTYHNINAHWGIFTWGLIGYGIVLVCDLVVSWGFWRFFQAIGSRLSGLAAIIRVGYTLAFGVACFRLLQGGMLLAGGDAPVVAKQVMGYFQRFEVEWSAALIVFGVHLVLIALLSWRSNEVPKWLALLIGVAGCGYFLDNVLKFALPNDADFKPVLLAIVAFVSIVGEVGMAVWLLLRVGKTKGG